MARVSKELNVVRGLKFGVEIEFINNVKREVIEKATEAGLTIRDAGYTHQVTRGWKLVTDASCGFELVSPILEGMDGLEELKKMCKALSDAGAEVNKSCGVHVHHDGSDFDLESVKNIYRFYHKHIEMLDTMMPLSRRANNNRFCKDITDDMLRQIERCGNMDELKWYLTHNDARSMLRYHKINFCSFLAYNTIEFRQHSGSTDGEKISNWVLLTHMIMQRARQDKKIKPKTAKRLASSEDVDKAYDFYMDLGINGTELANYIRVRRANLKRALVA